MYRTTILTLVISSLVVLFCLFVVGTVYKPFCVSLIIVIIAVPTEFLFKHSKLLVYMAV